MRDSLFYERAVAVPLPPGASSKLMRTTAINLRNVPLVSAPFQSFDLAVTLSIVTTDSVYGSPSVLPGKERSRKSPSRAKALG